MALKDAQGNQLESGFYIAGDGDVYHIQVKGETFTAENALDHYLCVDNFKLAATNFTRIRDPHLSARFITRKLEGKV